MNHKHEQTYGPNLNDILSDVTDVFGISIEMVKSKCRKHKYVTCRRIYIYVATEITDASLTVISEVIGLKDHTTSIFHRDTVKNYLYVSEPVFLEDWNKYIESSRIWNEYKDTIKKVA